VNYHCYLIIIVALTLAVGDIQAGDATPTVNTTLAASDFEASIGGEIVHTNELTVGPLVLHDVVSRPELRQNVLMFHECQATVYDGTAKGFLSIDFIRNRMHLMAMINNVDLGTMLAAFGGNTDSFSGLVSGQIELEFPLGKPEEAEGRGHIAITNGNLIELSFLTNLLVGDISNVRNQDSAEANFDIKEGTVRLSSARVVMPKGIMLISGTVMLDGSLRLLVIPRVSGGLLGQVWFVGKWFGSALAFASSHVARAVVRGNVTKPVVVINPFASN
jgi:AsmA-like C-terminal region